MNIHPRELELARAYVRDTPLAYLTSDQMKLVLDRGRSLYHWYKNHILLHSAVNLLVLTFTLILDFHVLLGLPGLFLPEGEKSAFGRVLIASLVSGGMHGWLLYSVSVFSVHEGAAHRIIFPGTDRLSRILGFFGNNICRLAGVEPNYYAQHHMSHHNRFGTEHDGEFLNFVLPRRYWLTFLPFANLINYTDFVAHRPLHYNKSRVISAVTGISYHVIYGYWMARQYGAVFAILTVGVIGPHVGFFLDRLRQFTEHNLMPLENKDGARSFGMGFWGMLVGGGPWGSPCHWEHHLVASLPWYQQLILHRHVGRILTPAQRGQYFLAPFVGFPKLIWRLLRETGAFARSVRSPDDDEDPGFGAAGAVRHP